MIILELNCLGDVWKIIRHTEFKSKRLEIKFIDGGEGNVWIVTKCNRLFNYGSDKIFKQKGKLLNDSNVGQFTEASCEFLWDEDDFFEETPIKREITHFSCGRYHTCLAVNRRWAYGCGYSSFFQTVSLQKLCEINTLLREQKVLQILNSLLNHIFTLMENVKRK